ncbi:MAG: VWA domain-containing protein [Aggregatilineales bacterium]
MGLKTMRADFALDYDVLTVQRTQKLYLLARLTAGPAPDSRLRRPLNLSVVIDRSGSMSGEKLNYTRRAAQFLVQNLSARDTLSIVLYNENVETLVPPEPVRHKDAIVQRIEAVKAGGTTNLSGGWLEGCNNVARNLNADRLNRVILMSDGLANRGITDLERLTALARQKFEAGVSTTTMGLGADFNEDLLVAMANAGGGAFYFIESPEVAPLIFQEELRGLLSVVGQNLVISLELSPYVSSVSQLNAYPSASGPERVSFRLGDVFGEEVKTLVLELTLVGLEEVGAVQIATLRFEYDELSSAGVEHRALELPVLVNVAPAGAQPALPNPEVSQTVLLLKAAQARNQAVREADRGNYAGASQVLRQAAEAIANSGLRSSLLSDEQQALAKEAADLARGPEAYDSYSRKMMSTQAVYTMTDRHGSTQAMRVRELKRVESGASAPRAARQPGVVPTHLRWNNKTFPLYGDLIRVGSASQNEIIIKATGVSRFHCQIRRHGDKLLLEDLGSTNGTVVNGQLISQPCVLSAGDEVYLCKERLTFHAG